MCHKIPSGFFPEPTRPEYVHDDIHVQLFSSAKETRTSALLPDIYGCNRFYRGLATYLADKGVSVSLVDPFHDLGELPQVTREAAFERRHKLKDKAYLDRVEAFLERHAIDSVIGFCLGGLYVFELARRHFSGSLVAFYPFPSGLPNEDSLPIPFDYLADVEQPHTILIGEEDTSIQPGDIEGLRGIAASNRALDLHVFDGSGHGFLADLDSDDEESRANARKALMICEDRIGL